MRSAPDRTVNALHLARPERVEVIFGRKVTKATPGVFCTRVLRDQVTACVQWTEPSSRSL